MATATLILLIGLIMAASAVVPWHSAATVDERTYLEMTTAIAADGLPGSSNGPIERFPSLEARWNSYRDGRLWGSMAPGFPYLAAPIFRVGGVSLLIRLNIALLALLAMAVFAIAERVFDDPLAASAAAWISIVSIPVWTASFGVSPYSLAITATIWAVYFALRAQSDGSPMSIWFAGVAGLLAGLGTSAHLLVLPMLLGLAGALTVRSFRLSGAFLLGAAPFFAALSLLNRTRFGSWNPISDGPCVWRGCPESGADPQSVGQMLLFAAPLVGWLALTALMLFLARRSRPLLSIVIVTALAALLAISQLRDSAVQYAFLAWGFLIDVSPLDMGEEFRATPDRLGNFVGPNVVKSLFQGSPFLVLTLFAIRRGKSDTDLIALPAAALFASLLLRANMPADFALGHPFLSLRYLMPAAPLLAILAIATARELPWRRGHVVFAILSAVALGLTLYPAVNDLSLARRYLLLRASLVITVAVLLTVSMARRPGNPRWRSAATWAVAVALGFGTAVTMGVDLTSLSRFRNRVDTVVDRAALVTPHRYALIGFPDELDALLTLRTVRDVEYADLLELEDWTEAREVVRWWLDEERPVFGAFPPADVPDSPWADLEFKTIDPAIGLVQIRPLPPPLEIHPDPPEPD